MPPGIRPQNLNDAFLAAARQARQKLPELSHNHKVRVGRSVGLFNVLAMAMAIARE
jgi:malonyl CoA-acyl carrier protein transacylase